MSEPRACTMAETGARARKGSGQLGGVSGHQKKHWMGVYSIYT